VIFDTIPYSMESQKIDYFMENAPSVHAAAARFGCHDVMTSGFAAAGIEGVFLTGIGLQTSVGKISTASFNKLFSEVLCLEKACRWLLGDTLLLAERQWGNSRADSRYDEACQATGMSRGTLRNIVSVCRAFPREMRRPELSFSHHAEAAVLGEDLAFRDEILARAAKEKMSVRDLRKAIRQRRAETMSEEEKRNIMPNDDRPFGLVSLPSQEEAKEALPIAYELDKAISWLSTTPLHKLTPRHKAELLPRLKMLMEYTRAMSKEDGSGSADA